MRHLFSFNTSQLNKLVKLTRDLSKSEAIFKRALEYAGRDMVKHIQAKIVDGAGIASSPGEYPRSQTGRLRDSIEYQIRGDSLVIFAGAEYARYLEDGTSKMGARPFMRRGIEETSDLVEQHLTKMIAGLFSK